MSLIKKKAEKPTEREALSSPREIRAQLEAETKQKTQAIQKSIEKSICQIGKQKNPRLME